MSTRDGPAKILRPTGTYSLSQPRYSHLCLLWQPWPRFLLVVGEQQRCSKHEPCRAGLCQNLSWHKNMPECSESRPRRQQWQGCEEVGRLLGPVPAAGSQPRAWAGSWWVRDLAETWAGTSGQGPGIEVNVQQASPNQARAWNCFRW